MKRKISIFLSLITVMILLSFFFVFAQRGSADTLLLAITNYETAEQKGILFDNSTRVWDYFEGEEVDTPTFLSLITEEQRQILTQNGLAPKILDADVDLSRYLLLVPHHPNQHIPTDELIKLGEVIPLSKYHILLKLAPGRLFEPEGEVAGLVQVPFPEKYIKPDISMETIPSPTLTFFGPTVYISPSAPEKPVGLPSWKTVLITLYIIGVLLSLIIVYRRGEVSGRILTVVLVVFVLVLLGIFFFIQKRHGNLPPNDSRFDLEIGAEEEF